MQSLEARVTEPAQSHDPDQPVRSPLGRRLEPALYAVAILVVGLAYRSTFIGLGFNATDEGFRASLARRIVEGQVPYRDFDTNFAPVSIYKEAAIQIVFGSAYDFLVSRWAFVVEATLASVVAYLILRMFVGTRRAFWLALPTTFFSILLYVYENYTYDGEFFALLSLLLLLQSSPARRWLAVASGGSACLAMLSKPPFAGFVVFVLIAAVLGGLWLGSDSERYPMLFGVRRLWPQFIAGFSATFVAILGAFALVGAAQAYLYDVFVYFGQSNPTPLGFVVWQDLPTAFSRRELELFAAVLAVLAVAVVSGHPWLRALALLAVPAGIGAYFVRHHDPGDFLPMAMGLLLVVNLLALAATLAVRAPWVRSSWRAAELKDRLPAPELFYFALSLQYLAQFTGTGIFYSYLGTFLSLPAALMFMAAILGPVPVTFRWRRLAQPALAPAALAVWLMLASILYVQNTAYFDYPRSHLHTHFSTPGLAGIISNPANVRRVDGLVNAVDTYTKPGDPIFVIPDYPALYELTGRRNPTRLDWYQSILLTPQIIQHAVSDLGADPPKVVIVETRYEQDYSRSRADQIIDYEHTRAAPIYSYIFAHYHTVEMVGDISVMLPN